MGDPILEMRRVSKSFFSIKALRNVDLTVYAGEIHALMGENGAGKSTLMKILSGAYRPDPGGEIRIEGKPVHIHGPLGGRGKYLSGPRNLKFRVAGASRHASRRRSDTRAARRGFRAV
jgi:ribose transport system ATP-binding protein